MKWLSIAALAGCVSAMSENGMALKERKEAEWAERREAGLLPRKVKSNNKSQKCRKGVVTLDGEDFPCEDIDFEGFLSLQDSFIGNETTQGSDIWGWLSPEGLEITIWCVDNGVWFVDTTEPSDMKQLGYMAAVRATNPWCDVKVYQDAAYVVKDGWPSTDGNGIQVFDLTRLVGLEANASRSFEADYIHHGHGRSHNLAVDTESGYLYSVGTTECEGGLFVLDLADPLEPVQVGCVDEDGYTHDVQCVVYDGPDTRFTGEEVCFAFNEDTLTIWNVSDKSAPEIISRFPYPNAQYTHQGWLNEDMTYVILDDELDEYWGFVENTTTHFVEVSNLSAPVYAGLFVHDDVSIDHNLYVWGAIHKKGWGGSPAMKSRKAPSSDYAYLSNYVAGIKVLDITNLPETSVVGKFDVAPDLTGNVFEGTWSHYMHPSGLLAVSSIDRGLFMLNPRMAFEDVKNKGRN